MNKTWTDSEKSFIRQNAETMKDKELAEKISAIRGKKVSIQAIRKQRQKMGIKKARGRGICSLANKTTTSNSADIARTVTRNI